MAKEAGQPQFDGLSIDVPFDGTGGSIFNGKEIELPEPAGGYGRRLIFKGETVPVEEKAPLPPNLIEQLTAAMNHGFLTQEEFDLLKSKIEAKSGESSNN